MNNFYTLKRGIILVLFLIFQLGLKSQTLANIGTVCNIDTIKKTTAIKNLIIKSDTTFTLKINAGSTISTIVKNGDTTLIINGISINTSKNTSKKTDFIPALTQNAAATNTKKNTIKIKKKTIEVKKSEPATTSFIIPLDDDAVQVKNMIIIPASNITIMAPPIDGIIQVRDMDDQTMNDTNQNNGYQHNNTVSQSDSLRAKKLDKSLNKADTITIKKTDTIVIKKTDTMLMRKSDTTIMHKDSADSTRVKAKNYYLEIGGSGLAISANYDTRFNNQRNGWGYRIGLGGFIAGGNRVFTIPFQINYLVGKHASMLELGAGSTFLSSTGDNKGKTWEFDKVTGFVGTASIGYRYQPEHKGINYRIAFVPIIYDEGIMPVGGISVGYTFK